MQWRSKPRYHFLWILECVNKTQLAGTSSVQVPARWLRAPFHLILIPSELYFIFSPILQRGDGFKRKNKSPIVTWAVWLSLHTTSYSLTYDNKKLRNQDSISWLPKFCFWIQWHDPAVKSCRVETELKIPPTWAGPGCRQGEGTAAHHCPQHAFPWSRLDA